MHSNQRAIRTYFTGVEGSAPARGARGGSVVQARSWWSLTGTSSNRLCSCIVRLGYCCCIHLFHDDAWSFGSNFIVMCFSGAIGCLPAGRRHGPRLGVCANLRFSRYGPFLRWVAGVWTNGQIRCPRIFFP